MTKQEHLNNIKNHICDVLKKNDIYRMEILFYGENQKATAEINCFAIDDENPIVSADCIFDDDGISLTEIVNDWLFDFLKLAIKTRIEKNQNFAGFLDMEPFYTGSAVFIENYKLQNKEIYKIYKNRNLIAA